MEKWLDLSSYCRKKYGRRLYRAALDGGFTCPTRDGTRGTGGCIFCSAEGSGEFAIPYHGQKLNQDELISSGNGAPGNYIAYFQAFTNTYGPIEKLRNLYVSALSDPLFAGISIATRPDCLGQDVISLLKELKQHYPEKIIWIELGLQTIHEKTAAFIRRGYSLDVFEEAVSRLHALGIEVIVHVILGLPDESKEMMLDTIRYLNRMPIQGVKLQSLQYLRGSDLGRMYLDGTFGLKMLEEREYVDIVTDCIAWLRPDIVIHRLTGDGDKRILIGPLWACDKKHVLNEIRHVMKEKNYHEGCLLEE